HRPAPARQDHAAEAALAAGAVCRPAGAGRGRLVGNRSPADLSNAKLAAVRGMNDVLPADIGAWQHLEKVTRELFAAYGFEELRVPVVEHTALFKRAIGEY